MIQGTEKTQRPARMVGSINSIQFISQLREQDVQAPNPLFYIGLGGISL